MRLAEAAIPVFARHETFAPRFGWFRKAYAFAKKDPKTFVRPDAPVQMGVGKNMVRSIRFWGTAAKLIQQDPATLPRQSRQMVPTHWGDRILGDEGWDPYLEDPATLWLVHWLILSKPCWLPVWWVAFNEFHALEFDQDDLEAAVDAQIGLVADWRTPHKSSIRKDLRTMIRTYAAADQAERGASEDILSCPLRDLRVIRRSSDSNRNRFMTDAKPSLPPAIIAFAALDYVKRSDSESKTVTVSHLAAQPGGPGKVFKLNEWDLQMALESAAGAGDLINLVAGAGAPQLAWRGQTDSVAISLLDDYFAQSDLQVTNGEVTE